VDANVLILRADPRELVHGKSLRLAGRRWLLHAMMPSSTSNVSTILTASFSTRRHRPGARLRHQADYRHHRIDDLAIFVVKTLFLIWLNRRPDMSP